MIAHTATSHPLNSW